MEAKSIEEIKELAESYSKNGISWHFHLLTQQCEFNESANYKIILENEKTGETFCAETETKPASDAEFLENLWYNKNKAQK